MHRRALLGLATAAAAATSLMGAPDAHAQSWKDQVKVFRLGIAGGENEADRLKNYACLKQDFEQALGVPMEFQLASDYAGVMQGLIAGTLDGGSGFGASAYAGMYLQDPNAVEPVVTQKQTDGSTGYYSVLIVRADSPYRKFEDLKGKSLAFADPNSTSGYLYPSFELKQAGYDPQGFFGSTGFAGGHEQGVVAVLNKQYDAAVTWASMVGDADAGYTSGNLRKMVDKGALKMSDIRILWQSSLIPNSPEVVRTSLPEDFRAAYKQFLLKLPETDYDCFRATQGGDFASFVEVPPDFYKNVIALRQEQAKSRRGS